MILHFALVTCRFLHDAAGMFLFGAFGFLWTCVPAELAAGWSKRLRGAAMMAAVLAVLSALILLPVHTAIIGDGWSDAVAPGMLWTVVWRTSIGHAWLADMAASILLLGAVYCSDARRPAAVTVTAGLLMFSVVLTGHAMMHEGWLGYSQQANDLLHVLAAGAWVGALVPLFGIMREFDDGPETGSRLVALERFSTAGRLAVVVILATGLVNTLLIVGRLPTDWSSPYQLLLAIKIVVVLVMVALAARNRLVLTPRLRHGQPGASALMRSAILGEVLLGVCAIALVSVFGTLDPS